MRFTYQSFRWALFVCVTSLFQVVGVAANRPPHIVEEPPLTPQEQLKTFHLPPGFEIQLVAAEPDVRKPMNLNFDSAGKLWFTHSVEYPYPVQPGVHGRDKLSVIQGINADGSAKEVKTFTDGLSIPIGNTPISSGAIVFSIPNIYRLTDKDNDGAADTRDILFGTFGQRDTHGLNNSFTRWIDGWIYACHGYINSSPVMGTDGKKITLEGGCVYRFKEDGSQIEFVTHGQVNPFGLAFDSRGDLFSADCHTQPAYLLLRGGYYPSFNKPHDGLGFAPPIMKHSHGSTGIAGIACYEAKEFPAEYHGNLFVGNPITHRINRDILTARGSSYDAVEQPDFLTCDDPWFRPVDIKLGPDGALYIADFYNCIIGHYEVPLDHPKRDRERGRIWRIVYTGAKEQPIAPSELPNLTKAGMAELIAFLGDKNITLRTLATHELMDRFGKECISPVAKMLEDHGSLPSQRTNGLWLLGRLGALSDDAIGKLAKDSDATVRVHLLKLLASKSGTGEVTPKTHELVLAGLSDSDPFVRRAAADCLGKYVRQENIQPLLTLLSTTPAEDDQLIHTIRMTLRDHLAVPELLTTLSSGSMNLTAEQKEMLATLCLGISTDGAADLALDYLQSTPQPVEKIGDAAYSLVRYVSSDRIEDVFSVLQAYQGKSLTHEAVILMGLQRAARDRKIEIPKKVVKWAEKLNKKQLANGRGSIRELGIALASDMRLASALPQLEKIAKSDKVEDNRRDAMLASVTIDGPRSVQLLKAVLIDTADELPLRQRAARALGTVNNEEARSELTDFLPRAPERLAVEIAAALGNSAEGTGALLTIIETGKASPLLLREPVVADRIKQQKSKALQERITKLTENLPTRDQQVRVLIENRITGFHKAKKDIDRGKQVFAKVCANCHKIDGEGQKIGPELDGIGIRGPERLLEDVLDPSRNVDQLFRTTMLVADGRPLSGLLKSENDNALVLIDSQGKEIAVNVEDIEPESRRISHLSPMPSNVQDLVPEEDFYHLMEFLLAHKPKGTEAEGN